MLRMETPSQFTAHRDAPKHRLAVPVLLPPHDSNEEISRRNKPGSRVGPEQDGEKEVRERASGLYCRLPSSTFTYFRRTAV